MGVKVNVVTNSPSTFAGDEVRGAVDLEVTVVSAWKTSIECIYKMVQNREWCLTDSTEQSNYFCFVAGKVYTFLICRPGRYRTDFRTHVPHMISTGNQKLWPLGFGSKSCTID